MRRAYRNALNRWLSGKPGPAAFARLVAQVASAHIRPGLARPPSPPILATIELTRQCNLQCRGCTSHETSRETERRAGWDDVIREIGSAGIPALGFTGGEPLLVPGLEDLLALSKASGMITHVNTNATLLTMERAEHLLATGIDSINVSLDGAEAAAHDGLRGPGSHARALNGVENLVRVRARREIPVRMLFVMRLCAETADQALPLLDLAEDLGFDGCSYLPMMRLNGDRTRTVQPEAVHAVEHLLRARAAGRSVDNSARYLKGMIRHFLGGAMPHRCSAPHSSLLVSADQKIYPCVPMALARQGGVPWVSGSLKPAIASTPLRQYIDVRICGNCWWNCHRELDLALGVI